MKRLFLLIGLIAGGACAQVPTETVKHILGTNTYVGSNAGTTVNFTGNLSGSVGSGTA